MKTKTLSLEKAILALMISVVIFISFRVPIIQLVFWSLYVAIAVFGMNYTSKASRQKAIDFCLIGFYVFVLGIILGAVALGLGWELSWSILIASFLSLSGTFISYSIITAPLMPDENEQVIN